MATGKQIKHYRQKLGWTLEQLESVSGVATGSIFALEKRDSERSKFFQAIASAFGLTVEQLSDESNDWQIVDGRLNPALTTSPPTTAPDQHQINDAPAPGPANIEQLMAGLAEYLMEMDDYARDNAADVLRRLAANPKEHARAASLFAAAFQSGKRKAA